MEETLHPQLNNHMSRSVAIYFHLIKIVPPWGRRETPVTKDIPKTGEAREVVTRFPKTLPKGKEAVIHCGEEILQWSGLEILMLLWVISINSRFSKLPLGGIVPLVPFLEWRDICQEKSRKNDFMHTVSKPCVTCMPSILFLFERWKVQAEAGWGANGYSWLSRQRETALWSAFAEVNRHSLHLETLSCQWSVSTEPKEEHRAFYQTNSSLLLGLEVAPPQCHRASVFYNWILHTGQTGSEIYPSVHW